MKYFSLERMDQWKGLLEKSNSKPILIFKHSTRCSVSYMAHKQFVRSVSASEDDSFEVYILDLIEHRDVSNAIAEDLKVRHESPQVLLIKNSQCIAHASHSDISFEEMQAVVS